ncbi:MAG: type VI secretion system Vgr family protein [Gammaproteobacteria bacterium]
MSNTTQKNRDIQIATPLGEDVLLFYRMTGREHLSQLFEYDVELYSESFDLNPEKLLGQNVTIAMVLPADKKRYFNGYVTRFGQFGEQEGFAYYRATIRPWLWFLSRSANCRIFQDKNTLEIIKQIFADQGFGGEVKDQTTGSYKPREYCVQYRETDFNFVSRLMEDEGIYYYFLHDNGKHQLVLVDATATDSFPDYQTIPFHQEQGAADSSRQDHVYRWGFAKEVQTGNYALTDFDPEKPRSNLTTVSSKPNPHPHAAYEIFDYPGHYKETGTGDSIVRLRREENQTRFERYEGAGNARGLSVGYKFGLIEHPREGQNAEYLIVAANYRLENNSYSNQASNGGSVFDCAFSAMTNKSAFRPTRITPNPIVHGSQTAIITGPAGEELYTDKYGRVKVQFHWDRYAKADENSSCWVRVSHPWAGKNWGMFALPRIGQEVIVDFLEGNPDQPIITGRVYNGESMPPYPLPSKAHLTTIKSNSTKGGGGFNELRFDDTKGKEQIFVHAQYNQDVRVKNDHFEWIGNERHLIVKSDQLEQVDGDHHTTVKGDSNQKVDGTISITANADMQEKVGAKYALEANSEIHLKAGANVVIEAAANLTIKAGSNFIALSPTGIAISGAPTVMINSGGSAGSGSGSSPDTPKLPKEAATDKPGEANKAPPAARPPKPTTYGPSATVLKTAAENGTPFCEKCAAAAAAAAAAAGA